MVFGFLKDKLKKVVNIFTKATTEEKPQEAPPAKPISKPVQPTKPSKPAAPPAKPAKEKPQAPEPAKLKTKEPEHAKPEPQKVTPAAKTEVIEHPARHEHKPAPTPITKQEETHEEPRETHAPVLKVEKKEEEKLGFFGRLKAAITTKTITREEFDTLFSEIEIELLENNVALEVVDKIREDLWTGLSTERFSRMKPEERVHEALRESLDSLFLEPFDILKAAKAKPAGEPYIICAIGVNGSGKTTTLAKLAHYFKKQGLAPVFAAGDTFRAAAIQQLEEHAKRIDVPIIKQPYGADAAAVAYDAIAYAKAHKCRVVLIDTAGRLHSNTNLMEELRKIVRVAKPDTSIFIGEATTGNDCVEQAIEFGKAVEIDGIVLSKVDVDERGGAALSISYVTRRPILFFGNGQTYDDLEAFDKKRILGQLLE